MMGYAKVNYRKNGLKVNFFTNLTDAKAPNLLLPDPTTRLPLQLNFSTQTYDVEVGDILPRRHAHVFSFGGNVRRNNFDITIAPNSENRTEIGAYVQDEIFLDKVRLTIGGRVDKFGNLSDPVFSPRLAAVFKPVNDHAIRVSFNRAFRSPSVINNFLDISIVTPQDLSGLAPLLPPPLQPLVAQPFPLVVKAVGSNLPIGSTPQAELTEESVTAYQVAYTGSIRRPHDARGRVLREQSRPQHQLRAAPEQRRPLHGGQPAARLAAAAGHSRGARAAGHLPAPHGVHVSQPRAGA